MRLEQNEGVLNEDIQEEVKMQVLEMFDDENKRRFKKPSKIKSIVRKKLSP